MLEHIGKYRILGQIGRGGMGTVYRAHDPILDRIVALKVISSDADVTDELRARFFREAQACAKLSHPNIITVHDLGDEDGHLFIVMEYLEGEELKQIIAQRRHLAIEDKLAIMAQVCAGLEYAHQKGVIHRDIKPGNIFVLRNGAVKILDFGIARLASANTGLTRTGLIMGTLRYMSPEQARGRVDPRSDIFSAGTVFYELLTDRPCFPGEDAMEILEQLRSHDPPPPGQIDAAIPPALSAAVVRAVRKDPEERYRSFGDLRAELELVRRQLEERSGQLRARLRGRAEEIERLRQVLSERAGTAVEEPAAPPAGEQLSFTAAEALDRELAATADHLAELVARAEALEPDFRRAVERLEQGDAEGAAAELGRIAQAMPQHARAAAALDRARAQAAELRRQRDRRRGLVHEAEAAFERGAYAECLEHLATLERPTGDADLDERAEALREAAAAALAAEEAARREALRQAEERAHRAGALAREARAQAEDLGAAALAAPLWSMAEARLAEADTALGREAHGPASKRLEEAAELYRRASDAARREAARRLREQAQRAQIESDQARRRALAADAVALAGEPWRAAEAARATAETALAGEDHEASARSFAEAERLYAVAAEAARREAARRAQERAHRARGELDQERQRARDAEAAALARESWDAAEAAGAEGDAQLAAACWEEASRAFGQASLLYRRARESAQRVALEQAQERARRSQAHAAEMRRAAEEAEAAAMAATGWGAAERSKGEAERRLAALAAGAGGDAESWEAAASALDEVTRLYQEAAVAARRQSLRRAEEQAAAARLAAEEAREQGRAAAAADLAGDAWHAAEARWDEGGQALARRAHADAARHLEAARDLYRQAAESARVEGQRRARARVAQAREQAELQRHMASQANAATLAAGAWQAAEASIDSGRAEEAGGRLDMAARSFEDARELYRRAAEAARQEAVRRAQEQAQDARARASTARETAREVDAPGRAAELWAAAEGKLGGAAAALARRMLAQAARQFEEATEIYGRAAEAAREEARRETRAAAEAALERAGRARGRAQGAGAESLAPDEWSAAQARLGAGQQALASDAPERAAAELDQAAELYERSADVAERRAAQRAREELQRHQVEAQQARGRAADVDATALAPETWRAAETELAEGQAAAARDARAESRDHLGEALRLYGQAEADARAAAREREAARSAVAPARDGAARARLEAEAAGAPARAASAWSAAIAEHRRAQEALDRGDVAAARELFGRAREAFQAAAQACRAAAETERLAAARRHAAAGDPERAVETLEALLADRPSHPEAERLLEEIRAGLAADAPLAPPHQGGELTETIAAAASDATVLSEETPTAAAARHPPEPAAIAAPDDRHRAGRPERAVPATPPAAIQRRRRLPIAALVAGLLLVAGGALYWYGPWRAATPPDPQAQQVAALRQQLEVQRERAQGADAAALAPTLLEEAVASEAAAERALEGRDVIAAIEHYRQALQGYEATLAEVGRVNARSAAEDGARRAREMVADARQTAQAADAPRLAPGKWGEAGALAQKAELALDRDPDAARTAFGQAERAYRDAAALAARAGEEDRHRQRQAEVARARDLAAEAREAARAADAPRHAPAKWADAGALLTEAEQALDRDPEAARAGFGLAERAYREAVALARQGEEEDERRRQQEARRAQVALARDAVAPARQAAEQAGADRHAAKLLGAARSKEKEGEAAFQRQDYERARQLLRGAETDYREAAREATQQLAALKGQVDQLRVRTASERDQAMRAEANILARPMFDRARSRQSDADALISAQDLAGARQAYTEAISGYGQALRQARDLQEDRDRANTARSRMAQEKSRASADSREYASAIAQERQADVHYQRLAFRDAADSFGAAADLYARATPPAPPRPPAPADPRGPAQSAEDEIRALLATYVRALETKDLALLRRVAPGLSEAEVQRMRDSFDHASSIKVDLTTESIKVGGTVAYARGRRRETTIDKGNNSSRHEARFSFVLVKTSSGWHIQALN